jgi:predicted RNase H-like HicB family nuclease
MGSGNIVEEVIVHPVDGMQLAEGYISMDASGRYVGSLPGMTYQTGETVEVVVQLLEEKAKAFYGDDVVVEVVHHLSTA